jgi:hypothetical protein
MFHGSCKIVSLGSLALLLLAGAASPARAAEAENWTFLIGLGAVDQDATGGTSSLVVGFERYLTPVWSFGLTGGHFGKKDCCGSNRDTNYGALFGSVRWPREGLQPFLQLGAGRYDFDGQGQNGWFGGVDVDIPLRDRISLSLAGRYHGVERPDGGPLPAFKEVSLSARYRLD